MYVVKRIILFVIVFTGLFAFVHLTHLLVIPVLVKDLGSVPWLYSTIGLIFSITSGFIIQTQWNTWDSLTDAVREEVNSLRQILTFSRHLPENLSKKITNSVKQYLESIINNWKSSENVKRSSEVNEAMVQLQEEMYETFSKRENLAEIAYSLFSNVLVHRENRIHYSSRRLPKTLKLLIQLSTFLIISLSFFIGVQNLWLDYIFTLGIGLLSFVMYEVIVDLEYPLHPGSWHVTSRDYELLLEEINKQ